MYKSTENPSLELLVSDYQLVRKSLQFAEFKRISRVIVHSHNTHDFSIIDNIAAEYPEISIWIKIHISDIDSKIDKYDNIEIIVCTSQNLGISPNVHNGFWEVDLEVGELPQKELLDKENILWHVAFVRKSWERFDAQILALLNGYVSNDLMIDNVLLPIDLIKEHPCNVYLCCGSHCHSQHGNIPRCITIDSKGDMYPYGITHNSLIIGNLYSSEDVISEYNLSKQKSRFIDANRFLYLSIVDKCIYSFVPWFEILGGVVTGDC